MIVIKDPSWWRIIFKWRGTALKRIWPRLLFVTLIACVITVFDLKSGVPFHPDLTPLPFTLVGLALGIFLGFRNNTSYDRFWEGRKLWGRLVNTARTITRQTLTLVGPLAGDERLEPSDEQRAFHRQTVHYVAAYVHCVRLHLRDEDHGELARLLSPSEVTALDGESNRPIAMLQTLGDRFREAWLKGWIHDQHLPVLDRTLTELCDIQGGCERIKATPIPFSYTALIHQIVAMYCFALPFGIMHSVGAYTPVVVAIISYAFFGLDAVGDEVEDPFGKDDNDLPLTSLSAMIELNIRQRVGDQDIPPRPQPVNQVQI